MTVTVTVTVTVGGGNGGQLPGGDGCCVEYLTLDISVCLAGLAGVLGEKGIFGVSRGAPGLRYQCPCRACAGILGEKRVWDWLFIFL